MSNSSVVLAPLRYRYAAKVLGESAPSEPHDGDTVRVLVRLGFRTLVDVHARIFGINCPELLVRGVENPAGAAAKAATWAWLIAAAAGGDEWPLVIDSRSFVPDDKFGTRADCIVYRKSDGASLADYLLAGGFAIPLKV